MFFAASAAAENGFGGEPRLARVSARANDSKVSGIHRTARTSRPSLRALLSLSLFSVIIYTRRSILSLGPGRQAEPCTFDRHAHTTERATDFLTRLSLDSLRAARDQKINVHCSSLAQLATCSDTRSRARWRKKCAQAGRQATIELQID
jgi:hypothetical protein